MPCAVRRPPRRRVHDGRTRASACRPSPPWTAPIASATGGGLLRTVHVVTFQPACTRRLIDQNQLRPISAQHPAGVLRHGGEPVEAVAGLAAAGRRHYRGLLFQQRGQDQGQRPDHGHAVRVVSAKDTDFTKVTDVHPDRKATTSRWPGCGRARSTRWHSSLSTPATTSIPTTSCAWRSPAATYRASTAIRAPAATTTTRLAP